MRERKTMKKTQKKLIEVQGYFDGHAPPMPPKKRSLPAEPAISPKPTTTKKGSV
jgi:hypothetical protein